MRRTLILIALVALALPSAALSGRDGDGTFVVKGGVGNVSLRFVGAAIGHFSTGSLYVNDPDPSDVASCFVTGAERTREIGDTAVRYSGTDIHFRCIGGRYLVRFTRVTDLSLAVVGQGHGMITGVGGADGKYSTDGSNFFSLPDTAAQFVFGTGL